MSSAAVPPKETMMSYTSIRGMRSARYPLAGDGLGCGCSAPLGDSGDGLGCGCASAPVSGLGMLGKYPETCPCPIIGTAAVGAGALGLFWALFS